MLLRYTDILLWIGIVLMLYGYLWKRYKHETRITAYILLGLFWVAEAPYFLSISDHVNAALCVIALPLFGYFAYNENLSKEWAEDPEVMRFLAGSISIAMLIYYFVQRIPLVSGALIKVVSDHTAWVLQLMGYSFTSGPINYVGNPMWYRANNNEIIVAIRGSGINIILACTALQTFAPAFSMIYTTTTATIKKAKALLIVIPALYLANIGRNVLVIYLTYEGITSFDMAHNQIAKTGSVIVLVILLFIVFELMPEFHENIMNILRLPKREPIHRKQRE